MSRCSTPLFRPKTRSFTSFSLALTCCEKNVNTLSLSFSLSLKQNKATFSSPPPPLSFTFGNKSFPPQIRGWVDPDKNATVQALGRSVGAIANSSNPLNATKAAASGLELYKQKTKALILGQSGLVTYASSVSASPAVVSDLKCFVDPATGQLVGLEQGGGTVSCSTAASVVVVPTSTAGYISQVKLAYAYDGAFVGRLIFELKANATAVSEYMTGGEDRSRKERERESYIFSVFSLTHTQTLFDFQIITTPTLKTETHDLHLRKRRWQGREPAPKRHRLRDHQAPSGMRAAPCDQRGTTQAQSCSRAWDLCWVSFFFFWSGEVDAKL